MTPVPPIASSTPWWAYKLSCQIKALMFYIQKYHFVLRECDICLFWFLFCIVFIFKNNNLIYVPVSICLLVDCLRTTKLDIYRFKKMQCFVRFLRLRQFSSCMNTLDTSFFLRVIKKEKHYFRNSYQINCDLISNCSNKIVG